FSTDLLPLLPPRPLHPPDLHSFPTRRSLDLVRTQFAIQDTSEQFCSGNLRQQFSPVLFKKKFAGSFISQRQKTNHGNIMSRNNRSEEHTSELQSRGHLVCRLLLEKKKPISTG